jgi:lauroyl/myristoyl acyltransferase
VSERAPFGRGRHAARVLRRAIYVASAAASRLPDGVLDRLADVGGTLEWAVRPAKRRMLAENLSRAAGVPARGPRARQIVRREVRNEARRSADFLLAIRNADALLETTNVVGLEHLRSVLREGRGVVLTTFHLGGWEVIDALPRRLGFKLNVVVTNDWLAWAVAPIRVRAGLNVVYDHEPVTRLTDRLRAGEVVLVLADYAKPHMRTYTVRLFGHDVDLPAGPATLARLCGSPVVPFIAIPPSRRRWDVIVDRPLRPPARDGGREAERALLQRIASRFTELVPPHVEHWAAVYPMRWR